MLFEVSLELHRSSMVSLWCDNRERDKLVGKRLNAIFCGPHRVLSGAFDGRSVPIALTLVQYQIIRVDVPNNIYTTS